MTPSLLQSPMRLHMYVAAGLVAAAPLAAQTAPCTTPTAPCERWIVWRGGPSRTLVYGSYALDVRNTAITRALIMVHGAGRNADHYFETAVGAGFLAGALNNTIILAPRYSVGADTVKPNEVLWAGGGINWRAGGPLANDSSITSFDLLDEIIRKLADKKVFPNLAKIVVAGPSAGDQGAA